MTDNKRTDEEYFFESKRFREEVLTMADELKDNPMRFTITNIITMDVEITVIRNFVPPKFRNLKPPEIGKVK